MCKDKPSGNIPVCDNKPQALISKNLKNVETHISKQYI